MSAEQLQVTIKVISPDGQSERVAGTIRPILGSIKSSSGCVDCRIYQDIENPEEITLFEEWRDLAAFAEHIDSKDYLYILEWMEMSARKPMVTVYRRSIRDGFEFIKRLASSQIMGR